MSWARIHALGWVGVALVAMAACNSAGSDDDGAAAAMGSQPEGSAASAPPSSGAAADDAADDGSCDSAGASPVQADGAPALACQTSSPESCTECIGEKCCDLLELCARDGSCACMAECIGARGLGGTDACLEQCRVTGSPPGFAALADCLAVACPDGDECSTPAGFAPPPEQAPSAVAKGSIGDGEQADCSFDAALAFDGGGELLQLESADGGVCVRLERRDDGPGSLANTQFSAIELRVGPIGEVAVVEGGDQLCYHSSHHNFSDWVHAWSGTRHYDLELAQDGHGGGRTYVLYVFEQGPLAAGSCAPSTDGGCRIGAPIELFPVEP